MTVGNPLLTPLSQAKKKYFKLMWVRMPLGAVGTWKGLGWVWVWLGWWGRGADAMRDQGWGKGREWCWDFGDRSKAFLGRENFSNLVDIAGFSRAYFSILIFLNYQHHLTTGASSRMSLHHTLC